MAPKFAVGDKVFWTNGVVGTVADGPFKKGLSRIEDLGGAAIYEHCYGYVVEFEDNARGALGDAHCRMLPEGALRSVWMPCSGEHRQATDGSWERRKN